VGEKHNNLNKDNSWKRTALIFYAKTTSWIVFPLVLAFLLGNYVEQSIGSEILFFAFIIAGFGITCFGIYKEIINYKKSLDIPLHDEDKKE
jgi:hypothetical protein